MSLHGVLCASWLKWFWRKQGRKVFFTCFALLFLLCFFFCLVFGSLSIHLSSRTSWLPGAPGCQPGGHEEQERGQPGRHPSGHEAFSVPAQLLRAGHNPGRLHPGCSPRSGASSPFYFVFRFSFFEPHFPLSKRFLEPGPPLIGFLQEAPVVARASLFLECARFVHRCNRGNWPEWMKGHHVNITKRGLSRGRSPIVGNKRNQKLQWNAAKHFCQWGDVSWVPCRRRSYQRLCCEWVSFVTLQARTLWPLSPALSLTRRSAHGSANCVTRTARVPPTSWVTYSMRRPSGEWGRRMRRRTTWTTVSRGCNALFLPQDGGKYRFWSLFWFLIQGLMRMFQVFKIYVSRETVFIWDLNILELGSNFENGWMDDIFNMNSDTVNPTKCGCPFALKMAACQLLLEITTFLRETFPCLPRPRTEPLVVSAAIATCMLTPPAVLWCSATLPPIFLRTWTAAVCVWTQS